MSSQFCVGLHKSFAQRFVRPRFVNILIEHMAKSLGVKTDKERERENKYANCTCERVT